MERTNPLEAEHATLLQRKMPHRERMDKANVEYMDYCAHVGDTAGMVRAGCSCLKRDSSKCSETNLTCGETHLSVAILTLKCSKPHQAGLKLSVQVGMAHLLHGGTHGVPHNRPAARRWLSSQLYQDES